MFDPEAFIRPHIRQMSAYEPILPFEILSTSLGRSPEEIIKLDANENPYGMLPAARQALAEMHFPNVYPDPGSQALRQALADYHHVSMKNILAGAGADELIDLVLRLLIDPGEAVLNCPPTFGMYSFDGELNGARVISIPRQEDFSLKIPAIEAAVDREKVKVIFLASPNNPDGHLTPRDEIERLLALPVLLVLDEAYMEFAPEDASLLSETSRRSNLVVLRTFSKWAGLAGLRVGFGVFPTSLMPHLWKIKQPYNVSVAASTAAIVSLQHNHELDETRRKIIAERERLFQALQTIEFLQPFSSNANFILCRVDGMDAAVLKQALAQEGILVRYFNKPGLQDCLRISVGKPEHTDALMAVLKRFEAAGVLGG